MGTSKGYEAPTDPQWAQLKADVTRTSNLASLSDSRIGNLIGRYIRTNGGAGEMARGGGAVGGSRAAQNAGRNLAGFADAIANRGLDDALREVGLERLIGRSAGEIALALTDVLCGDGSTLDEVDVRNAMSDLNAQLLEGADTYEEVKLRLAEQTRPDTLSNLLLRFFGHYLYHQFCRVFYQNIVRRHGEQKTESFLGRIRRFIVSKLRHETYGQNLSGIDWKGLQGRIIIDQVLRRTLEVFET